MTKKIFIPALLKEKEWRWYISFSQVHPATGELHHFRQTFSLNRIKCIKTRRAHGLMIVKQLNAEWLPNGYPYEEERKILEEGLELWEGLTIAFESKMKLPQKNSLKNYKTVFRKIGEWLDEKDLKKIKLRSFSATHAFELFDAITKGLAVRSSNNHLICCKAFFNELIAREYLIKNPFRKLKPRRPNDKNRRILTDEEIKILIPYIYEKSRWLHYAVMLQYFCAIRPGEIRELKFNDFDIVKGFVKVSAAVGKTNRLRFHTIPGSVLHFFREEFFTKHPTNYFVFGKNMVPGIQPVSPNRMNKKHKVYIRRLAKEGKLEYDEKIKFYSWKDTGVTHFAQYLSPNALKQFGGWTSMETASIYYHQERVNPEIKELPNKFF